MIWLLAILIGLSAKSESLHLRVGELRMLPAPATATVRIGSRGVIKAVDTDQGVRVIGLKPGATTLVIDDSTYQIRVSHTHQQRFVRELKAELARMMGLELSVDTKQVEVRGRLLRFQDWLRLAAVAREHQGEYVFRAHARPEAARQAIAHFTHLSRERGLPVVRFSAAPEFTVHIPKGTGSLRASVTRLFAPFGMHVDSTAGDLDLQPLVRTRVILAEVSKHFSREFGIRWPAGYEAQVLPELAAGPEAVMASLRALEAQGHAQILASPTLLCRSGGQARFHAGGEFPIRMINRLAQDVVWKSHGVILSVKPRADFQGALSLDLETEVSLLDMANAVDGVPALKKNTVRSHFDLPGKRTIALSGLLRQELGTSREGLPLLSSLPVLGPLFSSRRYQNQQSELIVFVTPEVHAAEAEAAPQLPEGWVRDDL